MSRLRPSPAMLVALLALVMATAGTSWAAIKLPKGSVGAKQIKRNAVTSAQVRDRSLLARDFRAGQLPRGAQGARGPEGPRGATGSVDTSNFYDKAASDTRFLAAGGTAANASALGGQTASRYVQADFGPLNASARVVATQAGVVAGGGPVPVLTLPGLGSLELASCSDPATSSSVRFASVAGAGFIYVWTDQGAANPTFEQIIGGAASTATTAATVDHVTFTVRSDTNRVATIDVATRNGTGGANQCFIDAVATTVAGS